MIGNHKISSRQCTLITMLFTLGTSILVIPSSLASIAKQDAWFAPIIGMGAGLIIVWIYMKIGTTFPTMNLNEVNEFVFGKWLGRALSLLFSFFCLLNSSQVLFYVGNFLTTEIMPDTPIEIIHVLFMLIVVMGVRLGLETLARTAEIFMPWVFSLSIIFLLSIVPQIKVANIEPIFENGIRPILGSTLTYLSYSCLPLVVLLVFVPKGLNSKQNIGKSLVYGFIGGSIPMIILTGVTILVLGPDLTSRYSYTVYALAKKINIGNFLQRIEAIIAGIWFVTIYFKLTFYFLAAVISISQVFNLKEFRSIVYPLAVIVIVLSLRVYPNTAYMGTWDTKTWIPHAFIVGLLYPTLLLAFAKVKKYFLQK